MIVSIVVYILLYACVGDDCDYTYTLLMKLDNDNSAYSSSGGRSSNLHISISTM